MAEQEDLANAARPVLDNQDAICPYIKWNGEWTCLLQIKKCSAIRGDLDYELCNHPDHRMCHVYLSNI
jgi:hypothetical protein